MTTEATRERKRASGRLGGIAGGGRDAEGSGSRAAYWPNKIG
jgi:hypothetical protein